MKCTCESIAPAVRMWPSPASVSVDRRVLLDLDDEIGVGEADAVAGRRAVVVGVGAAIEFHRVLSSGPLTRPFSPYTSGVPPSATSSTSFVSPGSNRTAVPAAM